MIRTCVLGQWEENCKYLHVWDFACAGRCAYMHRQYKNRNFVPISVSICCTVSCSGTNQLLPAIYAFHMQNICQFVKKLGNINKAMCSLLESVYVLICLLNLYIIWTEPLYKDWMLNWINEEYIILTCTNWGFDELLHCKQCVGLRTTNQLALSLQYFSLPNFSSTKNSDS